MLASSWKAQKTVEKAWLRLDPPTRDELARLTKIPATNLSGLNTGRLPMTQEMAERICRAVPGLTLADLGAREAEISEAEPTVVQRLEELARGLADSMEAQKKMDGELRRLRSRVGKLEAAHGAAATAPKRPRKVSK